MIDRILIENFKSLCKVYLAAISPHSDGPCGTVSRDHDACRVPLARGMTGVQTCARQPARLPGA